MRDCLYLNIWTPAKKGNEKLPVLVYFYGGGFIAGDGSEPRYDGESMARRGIIAITVNYRLGVLGFAHPELTRSHHMGPQAITVSWIKAQLLQWVQKNIAAFGGILKKITIAGSLPDCFLLGGQMASPLPEKLLREPLGKRLFARAYPNGLFAGGRKSR